MINNHDPGVALVGWLFKSNWAMAIHLENRQIMADSLMMFMTHLRGQAGKRVGLTLSLLHKLLLQKVKSLGKMFCMLQAVKILP